MTDTSPGPGWWLASDGNWYPPHLHPAYDARPADTLVDDAPADVVVDDTPADDAPADLVVDDYTPADLVGDEPVPLQPVPEREPIDWAKVAEEHAARRKAMESRPNARGIVGGIIAAAGVLLILLFVARNVGDDDRNDTEDAAAATTTTAAPTTSTTTAESTTVTVPGTVSVFTLQPGTCVNNADLASGLVTTVTEVPCDQPHSHEVYHKVTYTPPDGTYDAARISQFATEQCSQSFATYVGVPYDRSQYYFLNFAPTQESWTQKGDREVVCLLFLQGSELTGSAKSTAQ